MPRVEFLVGGFGVPEGFEIPESELRWRFDTSGGPGGQHANRSNTRVELMFDVASSRAFNETSRDRLVKKLGLQVRISEDGSRSQAANRKRALERLHAKLDDAMRPDSPTRRRTRPSARARKRRLESKRLRAKTKQQRRAPGGDD